MLLPQKTRSFKIFGKDGNIFSKNDIYIFPMFKPVAVFFCDITRRKFVAGSFKICVIYFCYLISSCSKT